uniref:Uncharacterized protein n=1 Tax=Corethron hystrix TaxID=216773 RepID=A0A7S1FS18_9STRA|mmetsp:Transcript_2442/g.4688  ORF Transcript_2442/g.4688 Transcript_2442/m.4688 type:complete len:383 (+) Transcript_2442:779-1927(+)
MYLIQWRQYDIGLGSIRPEPLNNCGSKHFDCYSWGFRESFRSQIVHAAYVDPWADSFYFYDGRVGKIKDNGKIKPVVCVDMSSDMNYVKECNDVTSICFSGEHELLTSHVYYSSLGKNSTKNFLRNTIKFWDRRFFKSGLPTNMVEVKRLASFPQEDSVCMRPTFNCEVSSRECTHTQKDASLLIEMHSLESDSTKRNVQLNDEQSNYVDFFIRRLTSSVDGSNVVLSLEKHDLHNMESSNTEVLINTSWEHMVLSECSNILTTTTFPMAYTHIPSAFTPDLKFMASIGDMNADSCLFLFDISAPSISSPCPERDTTFECIRQIKKGANNRGRKISSISSEIQKLVDVDGIPSDPTCIALNSLGTTLACGTSDGDIYTWRGA